MQLKEIIIKLDNKNIFFNSTMYIPVRNSNLPMDYMKFKFHTDIFWRIELIHYSVDCKCWKVKVSDYSVIDISTFNKQTSTRQIEKLEFEKLDWEKLEPQLTSYQEIKLINFLYNHNINTNPKTDINHQQIEAPFNRSRYEIPEEILIPSKNTKVERDHIPTAPRIDNISINFHVKFQDATFVDGYATFKKYIKQVGISVDFRIKNDYILKEFDNIKFWFSKMLKSKRFDVDAIITTIDKHFSEASATSSKIDMITPNIIESVKYDRTLALTKPPKTNNPDKSLYSTEDIFNLIDPDIKDGNVFNQSEPDIIKSLTQNDQVRNRKQLEYLSVRKQTTKSKIHYTLNPLFGFLFLIEGKKRYHFAWELLKSHATYIWSIDKEEKEVVLLYSKIEEILNIIRLIGREEYKKTYSNKDLRYDFNFKSIEHQDISANLDNGFTKWKSKLDELLT
jgi:hypothetical protein